MNAAILFLIGMLVVFVLLIVQLARVSLMRRRHAQHLSYQSASEYGSHQRGDWQNIEVHWNQQKLCTGSPKGIPLLDEQKHHFTLEWLTIQVLFAQNPRHGIKEAERVLSKILCAKGYPADDFDQLAMKLSVDFPAQAANLRELYLLAKRNTREHLDMEDMFRAMRHARILFEEIL